MKINYKFVLYLFHLRTKYLHWQHECLLLDLYAYFNIFGEPIFLATVPLQYKYPIETVKEQLDKTKVA